MPKLGMEPIRRDALIKATISEIGQARSLDVTVSRIAKRAGMSSALAFHYFGGKDQLLLAAMRHILTAYGTQVRTALAQVDGPQARLEAIIRASFEAEHFRPEVISAWLNFYVQAQSVEGARHLLLIYQARLRSNLAHALRPLVAEKAVPIAEDIATLIDGQYIRQALGKTGQGEQGGRGASERVLRLLDLMLEAAR